MFHLRAIRDVEKLLACVVLIGTAAHAGAAPQAFPSRSIDIVTHASPGGGTDTTARTILVGAREALGVSMAVLPKVGGGGLVAMSYVSRQPADG